MNDSVMDHVVNDNVLWATHCRSTDGMALAELLERHASTLSAVALRVTRNHYDADDAVQMAVEQMLLMNGEQRQVVRDVRAWMIAIVMNCSRNLIRRELHLRNRHHRANEIQAMPLEYNIEEVEAEEDRRQLLETLDSALHDLPVKYQDVITLHYIHGMQFSEVGEALGRSEESVKKQSQRGIQKIRTILERRGVPVAGILLLSLLGQLRASESVLLSSFPSIIESVKQHNFIGVSQAGVHTTGSLVSSGFKGLKVWMAGAMFLTAAILCILYSIQFDQQTPSLHESADKTVVDRAQAVEVNEEVLVEPPQWRTLRHRDVISSDGVLEQFGDILAGRTELTEENDRVSIIEKEALIWHLRSDNERKLVSMRLREGFQSSQYILRFRFRVLKKKSDRGGFSSGLLVRLTDAPAERIVRFQDDVLRAQIAQVGEWKDIEIMVQGLNNGGPYLTKISSYVNGEMLSEVDIAIPPTNIIIPLAVVGIDVEVKDLQVRIGKIDL